MRLAFHDEFDEALLGVRTKKIVELVAGKIAELDPSKADESSKLALEVIKAADVQTKDNEAKALFFISKKQVENLAQLAVGGFDAKDKNAKSEAKEALKKGFGIDISLFGRMVADDPSLNTDASAQVAHAISTHRVDNEYDYFTASDDMAPEDNAGAGMIGTVEYNSSTLYRYATVAAHELFCQLNNDTQALSEALVGFARAFVLSMPTGKQNTFANRTLPDAVLIMVRTDQPINLVGAFETPVVKAAEGGYVSGSINALERKAEQVYGSFANKPEKTFAIGKTTILQPDTAGDISTVLESLATDIKARFEV
jgi:CRISPR system Cascade subunit CasC